MKETGLRNSAFGADKFGLKDLAAVHWNLTEAPLYEHAIRNGEATIVAGGALCAETGHHTGRSPKDKHTMVDALTENTVWWDGNRKQSQEHFDNMLQDFLAHAKGKTLYAQDLYGGADPQYRIKVARLHRIRLALAVHPPAADPSGARRARGLHAGHDHHRHAVVQAGRQASRRPRRLRHAGRDRLHPQDRPDLRLVLRGRDEEVGVHDAELLSAGAGRHADALLGQRRQGRRQRAVLRPVRHRQDHAVGRSEPHPDRRRRDRLVAERHLQLRGRLLRQDHQALAGSRADDLGRHQPLRRRARERRVRSGDPRSGLRQRQADREHAFGLSARLHPERVALGHGRASEEHHLPDRRRLRRDAADRQADAGAGDVSLPLRLHREGRGHREGSGRRRAGILHLLRRAVPAAPAGGVRQPAARLHRQAQGRLSGW